MEQRDTGEVDRNNKKIYEGSRLSFLITGPDAYNWFTGIVRYNEKTDDFWIESTDGDLIRLDHDLLHVEVIEEPMKLFEVFNGSMGESCLKVFVIAVTESIAKDLAVRVYKDNHSNHDNLSVDVLCSDVSKEWVSEVRDY